MLNENVFGKLMLTSREAAELLSISERTLWTLKKKGIIKAKQIGRAVRYPIDVLREYVTGDKRQES